MQKKSGNEIVTVADQERNNKPDTCRKELVECIYLRHPLTKQPYVPSTTMSKFITLKLFIKHIKAQLNNNTFAYKPG